MSYIDTFIQVASDTKATAGTVPPEKPGGKTVAGWQYELLGAKPHRLTERELYFQVHCRRNAISKTEAENRREEIMAEIFARPQACLRTSPLPKTYGWGVHYDSKGRIALVAMESENYRKLSSGDLKQTFAMRSKR